MIPESQTIQTSDFSQWTTGNLTCLADVIPWFFEGKEAYREPSMGRIASPLCPPQPVSLWLLGI